METKQKKRISDWQLQRYHLGFLSTEEVLQLEEALSQDQQLRQKLAELESSIEIPPFSLQQAEQRLQVELKDPREPVEKEKTKVSSEAHPSSLLEKVKSWKLSHIFLSPKWGLAMAAVLLLPTIWLLRSSGEHQGLIGAQVKGAKPSHISWSLFVLQGKKSVRLETGRTLQPDSLIRFQVTLTRPMCLMLVSLEASGKLSLYWPYPRRQAVCLKAGKHDLPKGSSIPLDDTLGWERFILFGSQKTFMMDELQKDLQARYQRSKQNVRHIKPRHTPFIERHLLVQKK